jgi:hypothetical protein
MVKQKEITERKESAPEFCKPLDESQSETMGKDKRIFSK